MYWKKMHKRRRESLEGAFKLATHAKEQGSRGAGELGQHGVRGFTH